MVLTLKEFLEHVAGLILVGLIAFVFITVAVLIVFGAVALALQIISWITGGGFLYG